MINTIIFDFGGVLGSDADIVFIKVLTENGFTKDEAMKIWKLHWPKLKEGIEHVEAIWSTVKDNTSVDIQKIISEYNSNITVDKEILDLCKKLRRKYKLGILANESLEWMNIKREKGKLSEIFDKIIGSAEIKLFKPNKEAYEYALNSLKSKPEETLFIDNMERNTKAAENLGIKSIFFRNIDQLKKDLFALSIDA